MSAGGATLSEAVEAAEEGLLTCVHCGFCLPACPTYVRLGDENDSPRGRLHLMRAVVEGRLDAGSEAFQTHIDRCLGCRACEPVCPSGVPYGSLLELARGEANRARPRARPSVRLLLALFGSKRASMIAMAIGRLVRGSGLAQLAARVLPDRGRVGQVRRAAGMLAASASAGLRGVPSGPRAGRGGAAEGDDGVRRVGLLEGCVQQGLYGRVNRATARALRANGYAVVRVPKQGCCGALHAHGGDLDGARALARRNIEAFERARVDRVVVNAAGCGAAMKEYGAWFTGETGWEERAARFSDACVDVSEALASRGPRRGAPLDLVVTYDAPCHLLHAQGVDDAPLRVLDAVPGMRQVPLPRYDECCGGAGVYGLTHPDLGGRIGADKARSIVATGARLVVSGNPGCMMQIGMELAANGSDVRVAHPVEVLDESYRRAGLYQEGEEQHA